MTEEIKQIADILKENQKDDWNNPENIERAISESNKIRKGGGTVLEPGASFTYCYVGLGKEKLDYLESLLQGKLLVDLGAGYSGDVSHFSHWVGASKYIGVDLLNPMHFKTNEAGEIIQDDDSRDPENRESLFWHQDELFFQEDMLRYVSKLPDNFCNIVINGIDSCVAGTSEYIELLCRHISRVVKNGIVLGVNSGPVFNKLKELGFKEISGQTSNLQLQIFQNTNLES